MKIMFALQAMNWVIHFTSFESQCFSLFFSTAQQCFKPYFKNLRRLFIIIIIDRSFYKWIDFLIILADLNNAMVFTILTHPCTSNSSNFDSRVFRTFPSVLPLMGKTVTLICHTFLCFRTKSHDIFQFLDLIRIHSAVCRHNHIYKMCRKFQWLMVPETKLAAPITCHLTVFMFTACFS